MVENLPSKAIQTNPKQYLMELIGLERSILLGILKGKQTRSYCVVPGSVQVLPFPSHTQLKQDLFHSNYILFKRYFYLFVVLLPSSSSFIMLLLPYTYNRAKQTYLLQILYSIPL